MAAKKPVAVDKNTENIVKKKQNKKPVKKTAKKKQNRNKPDNTKTLTELKKIYITHTGEKLSVLQGKFVDLYIETGIGRKAVIEAGYKVKNPDLQANLLLRIPKIIDEVNWRMKQLHENSIAKTEEILEYYTKVMRGEEKDQFGLDAPLAERTKAASELAKRLIDIPNKLEGKATGSGTVTISLNWEGMEDTENEEEQKE